MSGIAEEPLAVPRGAKDRALRLIALFKFAKALLLVAVGLGALQLLDPDTAARAQHWATAFATSSDRRFVQHLLARAMGLSPGRLEVLALGTFLYAGLFTTEGLGLWLGRRWAEYLTVVATASFVPIEIFEILQRLDLLRVGALVMNLAVVAYLVYRLRRASGPTTSPVGGAAESKRPHSKRDSFET
jgi:uncharacterized membrane protein (DUF2068 family)